MKRHFLPITFLVLSGVAFAEDKKTAARRAANTVVLDESGVQNLKIETVEAEESDFEKTVFALGRIQVAPGHRAVVSSRVPGRVLSVAAHIDTTVEKGAEVAVLESRQAGDPPPSIRLTAPLSGWVSAVQIVPGQPVTPDDSLVEIIDLQEVHAVAAVPEHLAGQLQNGQAAHIRVAALPGRTFAATLAHLGVEADAKSGTLEAVFHVENADGLLRPGLRAEFSIVLEKRAGVVAVPRAALQGDALARFVYVEDFDLPHAFVKSPVVIGEQNDRLVEITSGLLPGDKVVTRGAYSLAFAGNGNVSLKEALDAAHGHEHAADGSELKEGEKAATVDEHGHGEKSGFGMLTILLLASNGLLLALLVVSMWRKPARDEAPHPKTPGHSPEVQP